jgi:hypothetical protein
MTRLIITGEYAADWGAISRETRDAADWRCVRCRHPFDSETGRPRACDEHCDARRGRSPRGATFGGADAHLWWTDGLNFGVHHFDGDKSNNAWWNRLALCNSCHLYIQGSVIPERPYLFEHSDWMVPYVCGYFASSLGGVAITRDEALADPKRWLALGQPWLYEQAARDVEGGP